MLLLHGYLSSNKSFAFVTEYFKNYYRVIAPDFSGFGESKKLEFAYSLDDYVLEIQNLLTSLNVKKCNIIAHSFGARVAIKLAVIDSRVKKLIITGGAGLKPKKTLKTHLKILSYKLLKRILPKKTLENFGSSDYKQLSKIQKQSFVKIVNEHLDKYLTKIQNQTFLIFGKHDKETPLYFYKRFLKGINKCGGVVFENSGHFCFIDEPLKFNLVSKEFLTEGI